MSAINNENKKRGRPFKMEAWIEKLEEVLQEKNVLFLSDKDLRLLVNQKLDDSQQISKRTLDYWLDGENHPTEEIGKKFISMIELARLEQKEQLMLRLMDDPKAYKAMTWILERKFEEFNLKKISERITKNENTNIIQITAGNEAQRMLIDNIINVDFTEVMPKGIASENDNKKEDKYEF